MSKLIKKAHLLFKSERFVVKGLVLATLILLVAVPFAFSVKQNYYGYGYGYSGYGYGYGYSDAVPATISSLTATANSTSQITLSWTATTLTSTGTSLNNFSSYKVYYATSSSNANSTSGTLYTTISTQGGSGTTISQAVSSGLNSATTYYFAVYTIDDASNWSAISNVANATTSSSGGVITPGGGGTTTTTTTTTTGVGVASATINAAVGGTVTVTKGFSSAQVSIPAGALAATGEVTVKVLSASQVTAPAASSGTFLIGGLVFEFTVGGGSATFNKPVTLTFKYNDLQVQGLNENNLKVYQWNTATSSWEALTSTVDTTTNTITAQTTHFSVFAIMASKTGVAISGSNIPIRSSIINTKAEDTAKSDFKTITGSVINVDADMQIVYFMAYGASAESKAMSQRDRKGVITDFVDTFGRVPSTTVDWSDIAKILSSHRPTQRNLTAEKQALTQFGKIYKRMPDYKNVKDEWALYYIAYNIRPTKRNTSSEKFAIGVFKKIYGAIPTIADDWAIVRAIAYTGAKR